MLQSHRSVQKCAGEGSQTFASMFMAPSLHSYLRLCVGHCPQACADGFKKSEGGETTLHNCEVLKFKVDGSSAPKLRKELQFHTHTPMSACIDTCILTYMHRY